MKKLLLLIFVICLGLVPLNLLTAQKKAKGLTSWTTEESVRNLKRARRVIKFDASSAEAYQKDLLDLCKRILEVVNGLKEDMEKVVGEGGAFVDDEEKKNKVEAFLKTLEKKRKDLLKRQGYIKKTSWGLFRRNLTGRGYQRAFDNTGKRVLKIAQDYKELGTK